MSRSTRIVLLLVSAALGLFLIGFGVTQSLQAKISKRLERGWVLPPLELYSQGFPLAPGRQMPVDAVLLELENRNLQAGRDYFLENAESCAEMTQLSLNEKAERCLWLKEPSLLVTWDKESWILDLWQGTPWTQARGFPLFPRLITQFYDGQPILQQNTPLSEFPLACLQGVTAIEDREFLEHKGVSATGILRAIYRNLKAGRWAEGGSTITQQLVKNFFLESKKTLKRKIEEQFLAILLEAQLSKDQILEMYLNVIYMGQSGPYQVRGLASAAQVNFNKKVSQLSLQECALLAAMINSPGRYSPFEHPEAAHTRRDLVLKKMHDGNMIGEMEFKEAAQAPVPKIAPAQRRTHAPYYVMSALREFESLEISAEDGARLYTTLDPDAQTAMLSAISTVMPTVEKRVKNPTKQTLQVAALAIDIRSAEVIALTGGRDYRFTQFNRAIDSRRQIGSIVKPFVYWPALKENSPLTAVSDENFEWKTGKQTWKPKNYESKTVYGQVPYFFSLAMSLNVPTARVGQSVGLDAVIDTLKSAGITNPIPNLPSLTLGALELSPMEVAQAYLTLSRFGTSERVHLLSKVEDIGGKVLFEYQPSDDATLDPAQTAILVGMMRQALEFGTAKSARLLGLEGSFAGKTGTTSDTKDAWFSGFNSRLLVVVWVGYDDNTNMGLTGASAALPVWVDIMKGLRKTYSAEPFAWPPGVEVRSVKTDDLRKDFPNLPTDLPEAVELVFANFAN